MTSGLLRRLSRTLLLLCSIVLSVSAAGAGKDAADLLARIAAAAPSQARFTETRQSDFLDVPLVSTGVLRFSPPDELIKEVHKPRWQRFVIRGDDLRVEEKGAPAKTISLDQVPALRAFVESFRATLAGKLEELKRYYKVTLVWSGDTWRLRLIPREQDLARVVDSVEVSGAGETLQRFTITQTDGDKTILAIAQTAP